MYFTFICITLERMHVCVCTNSMRFEFYLKAMLKYEEPML